MIKRLIDEKGHEIMPFSLSSWTQIVSSVYRMNVSGTNILNFQKKFINGWIKETTMEFLILWRMSSSHLNA